MPWFFVDASLRIIRWNAGAERLTGLSAESVYLRNWVPSLLRLRDEHGCVIHDEQCPMAYALRTCAVWSGRLNLRGRDGHVVNVHLRASPVTGEDGTPQGLVVVLRDSSPEESSSEHTQHLRDMATRDPAHAAAESCRVRSAGSRRGRNPHASQAALQHHHYGRRRFQANQRRLWQPRGRRGVTCLRRADARLVPRGGTSWHGTAATSSSCFLPIAIAAS